MPRNVVCIALLTVMFATGALPRTALASCSGNTCSFGQFGKVTYLAAKQSTVAPLLTKIDTSYTSAFSSYSQAIDLFKELKSLTSKFGTKEQIAAEALARQVRSLAILVYDGQVWTNGWNSPVGGSLPRAARVRIELAAAADRSLETEIAIPAGVTIRSAGSSGSPRGGSDPAGRRSATRRTAAPPGPGRSPP